MCKYWYLKWYGFYISLKYIISIQYTINLLLLLSIKYQITTSEIQHIIVNNNSPHLQNNNIIHFIQQTKNCMTCNIPVIVSMCPYIKKTHFTFKWHVHRTCSNIAIYVDYGHIYSKCHTPYISNVSILQKSGISFSALSANRLKWN